jgi:hypothetical protein
MNWSKIIRQIIAVVVASAIPVGLTAAFVGWSDGLGLGLFLAVMGVGIATMVHFHRFEKLYSNEPMWRSIYSS